MISLITSLVEALLDGLTRLVLGWRRDEAARTDAMARGRDEAAIETAAVVEEISDAQARVAVDGPDGADALAAELRARAARLGGGGGGRT